MTTTYRCPNCGQTATIHITPTHPPICASTKHSTRAVPMTTTQTPQEPRQ